MVCAKKLFLEVSFTLTGVSEKSKTYSQMTSFDWYGPPGFPHSEKVNEIIEHFAAGEKSEKAIIHRSTILTSCIL